MELAITPLAPTDPLAKPLDRPRPAADPAQPLRVAIIGCGAITAGYHLPVLAGHEGVRVTALVDRDVGRAAGLAQAYGIGSALADATELGRDAAAAAVVATPRSTTRPAVSTWPAAGCTPWSKSRWPSRPRTHGRWRTRPGRPASC
jgi:hypothetical protein